MAWNIKIQVRILILSITSTLILSGCSNPSSMNEQRGARIRFGESIEGLSLDMDSSTVINLLGPPDATFSYAAGNLELGDYYRWVYENKLL